MIPLHHGQYVHLDVLPTGGLRITLTPEAQEVIVEERDRWNDDGMFLRLCEDISLNGNNGIFIGHATDTPGNLSEAPIVLEDSEPFFDEINGIYYSVKQVDGARFWYWNDYAIISILEHIKRQGEAILTLLT